MIATKFYIQNAPHPKCIVSKKTIPLNPYNFPFSNPSS